MVKRDSRAWWKSTTKTWRTCSASVYSAPWCSYGIAKVGETVCVWPSSASASAVWTTVKWTSDGARLKSLVFVHWDSSDSLRNKAALITEESKQSSVLFSSAVAGFWQKKPRLTFSEIIEFIFLERKFTDSDSSWILFYNVHFRSVNRVWKSFIKMWDAELNIYCLNSN